MKDRILDAAVEEVLADGVKAFSIERLAQRAAVSRTTVYRHFANKDVVIAAVVRREIERVFALVAPVVDAETSAENQLVEGFAAVVAAARDNPLFKRMLDAEPDVAVKFATSSRESLDVGRHFVAARLARYVPEPEAATLAEVIVRVGFSFVVMHDGDIKMSSADEARAFARRFLVPMLA